MPTPGTTLAYTTRVPRILVIDDEEQVRRLLSQALKLHGYEVTLAANGQEGVREYRRAQADLIITDILMPDREGLEIIQELRREFPTSKIFTISGADEVLGMDVLEVAKRFGALRTFKKPFDLHDILKAVKEVVPPPPRHSK